MYKLFRRIRIACVETQWGATKEDRALILYPAASEDFFLGHRGLADDPLPSDPPPRYGSARGWNCPISNLTDLN